MTGHVGERTRRAVGLVTDDFRLYHRVVPYLESHGIPVLGLHPRDPVPTSIKLLFGGPGDDLRSRPLPDTLEATLLAVRVALDPRHPGQTYARVVFGVDPGRTIGIACVADNAVLMASDSLSVEDAVQRVAAWSTVVPARRAEVHVGDGHPQCRQLTSAFRAAMPEAKVLLVGEEGTTPFTPQLGSRHADAAVLIALRE